MSSTPQFDAFAEAYEDALQQGLDATGESGDYFVAGRVAWTARRLYGMHALRSTVVDFGCGTGATTPHLLAVDGVERVLGVDVSRSIIERAASEHASHAISFHPIDAPPAEIADLVYCNGVFHHIAPAERPEALAWVRDALCTDGIFALWENNPWNPGTRLVMHRIPFDRDAETLSPPQARRLLAGNGFEVLRQDFLFWFPRALAALRRVEPRLARVPLGGQYLTLARRV